VRGETSTKIMVTLSFRKRTRRSSLPTMEDSESNAWRICLKSKLLFKISILPPQDCQKKRSPSYLLGEKYTCSHPKERSGSQKDQLSLISKMKGVMLLSGRDEIGTRLAMELATEDEAE
jgi:hypothetical protein